MPIFYDVKPKPEGNYDATVYVGGLDERVTKRLLWELFIQVGPVVHVNMPRDRIAGTHQGYGFVEFEKEVDAEYAIKIFNMIKVFGKPIRLNKSATGGSRREMDVGAKLFVGNLDADVDEKFLFDTFSAFGTLLNVPKVMRDPETGRSRGFGFVNFTSFGAADMALAAMNGQHLCNRPITCSYAFKKDGEGEERHGSEAERLLAERNPLRTAAPTAIQPHMMFAPLQQPPPPYNSVPPPPSYMQQQVMSMQPMMRFTQEQMDVDPTRLPELLPPPPPPPPPPSIDD